MVNIGKHIEKTVSLKHTKALGEKWVSEVNKKFSEEPWVAHKYVKLFLSLSSIREIEIKHSSVLCPTL